MKTMSNFGQPINECTENLTCTEKRWKDSIREWTGLEFAKFQRAVEDQKQKKKKMSETVFEIICGAPTTPVVLG